MLGIIVTPSGMHGSAIVTSTYLHGELYTSCFPFLFFVAVYGPYFGGASSLYDSSSPVTSSTCTCSFVYGTVSMKGFCIGLASSLGSSNSVISSFSSFL
jgi:hypothetical protein